MNLHSKVLFFWFPTQITSITELGGNQNIQDVYLENLACEEKLFEIKNNRHTLTLWKRKILIRNFSP